MVSEINLKKRTAPTVQVDIWIAGDYQTIVNACLRYCERGLCVHVTPTKFAYTHGVESGAKVGLINYPRFPCDPEPLLSLWEQALDLAEYLVEKLSQGSCTVVGPTQTVWLTRRRGDE